MLCFGSADSKGVTGVFLVSADSKGDSTREVDIRQFKVERRKNKEAADCEAHR